MSNFIFKQRFLLSGVICIVLCFFVANKGMSQQVQKPDTHLYDHGMVLFENGLYEQSARELSQFIDRHPQNSLALSAAFYRTRARAETHPKRALMYYRRFISQYPQTAFAQKILVDLAQKEVEAGEYEQAISHYKRALNQSITKNQSAKIYYWMAQAEVKNKNYYQARQYYAALAGKYRDTEWAPKALFARGRLFLRDEQYKKASETFRVIQKRYPNNKINRKIGTALGQAYFKQKKYQKAIKALKKNLPYLEGDQKEKAILLIGESYSGLNEFEDASAKYLQYINMTKGTDKERMAHYGLGWVYYKQKIYHWAAREFGDAAQGTDTLARKALYFKAINEKLAGRENEAIKTFKEFDKRFPGGLWYEHAHYEWAVTAYQMGNYGDAIEALLKMVRSDNKLKMKGKIYTLLGQAYFANKEYTRALKAYNLAENMADIDPRVERKVRYQKAWMQYFNQAYQPAQKVFADLYQKHPDTDIGKKALFWNANAFYHLHKYNSAVRLFKEYINKYPHDKLTGPSLYSLGWSYFKMGQYQQALSPFRKFLNNYEPPKIALYPYKTDTKLRMGDSYYALSDYDKAIQVYKKSVNDDPGGDYAMFQIGNCYFRAGQIYMAVKTFRNLQQRFPKSGLLEQAQYNIAYIYLNTGNFQQAIKEFKNGIQQYPRSRWAARSQFNIGDAYYNQGKYQKAIDAYRKVMNNYPRSDFLIQAANGIRYAKMASKGGINPSSKGNQSIDTTSVITNFVKNNPHAARAADRLRFNEAQGLVQSGDYIKAIDKLEDYTQSSKNPNLLPDAYFLLAESYKKTNHVSKAVKTYQAVVEKFDGSDESSKALLALGQLMYQQQNFREAYQYYQRLTQKSGKYQGEGHVGMGNVRLKQGQNNEAKSQYQAALSANSDNQEAKIGLAKVDILGGNYEQAVNQLHPIARNNTDEIGAEAQYYLGMAQQRQQHYEEALQAYATLQSLYQSYDHWMALSMLKSGQCYFKLGNKGQGLKILQSLIKSYPQSRQAARAQQLMKKHK